jgi:cell division protein FtsL
MKLVLAMTLFVISSLALVDARYNGRVLHTKKEELQKNHERIKSEISSYQVLLTELEDASRIIATAENVLKMRRIRPEDTVNYSLTVSKN